MKAHEIFAVDAVAVAEEIAGKLRAIVGDVLKRRGAVVALTGGVDASAVAGLAVNAFGRDRVLAIAGIEKESDPETLSLSRAVADTLGIELVVEDLTALLRAAGAYSRRDDAIRTALPRFGDGWRAKIVMPELLDGGAARFHSVVATEPNGSVQMQRLSHEAYLAARSAIRLKERARAIVKYFHADRLHFAVAGSANRIEHDQAITLKGGDGLVDVEPIAHLYKSQVYAVARAVGIPDEILALPPPWDRYPLSQGQDDFYFSLPYDVIDLCLWARHHRVPPAEAALWTGLSIPQVERFFGDIEHKRRARRHLLHRGQLLVEPVPEIDLT